jgi:hypothetical protein
MEPIGTEKTGATLIREENRRRRLIAAHEKQWARGSGKKKKVAATEGDAVAKPSSVTQ